MLNYTLKPTNDYVFKRIFGYVGNEEITKDFLNAILDEDVKSVTLDCKQILEQDLQDDKFGILDIKAIINDNISCNIEMQVVDHKDIENRILYYWAKMYTQNIKIGEPYNLLQKTMIVLITDYEIERLKNLKKTISKWQIKEAKEGKIVLTELLEFYIIELPKFDKYTVQKENIKSWIKFIKNPEVLTMREIEKNETLKMAAGVLDYISGNDKEKYMAEKRFMYLADQMAIEAAGYDKGLKIGEARGRQEGRTEGEKQAKLKIAKELLKNSVPEDIIVSSTGLTKKEIEKLRKAR